VIKRIQDGVWIGKVEAQDGEWLIGNKEGNFPEGHPGLLLESDPRGLMFKVWTASLSSPKYIGRGWEPPTPAHGGRLEMGQVFTGELWCEHGNSRSLLKSGSGIELPSNQPRRWFFPNSETYATGTTLCRHSHRSNGHLGSGEGYEYRSLFLNYENRIEDRSSLLSHDARHQFQLFVVFSGKLLLISEGEQFHLNPLEYAFIRTGTRGCHVSFGSPFASATVCY
jgi:hypothetical protein